jgi:hypothetical protein
MKQCVVVVGVVGILIFVVYFLFFNAFFHVNHNRRSSRSISNDESDAELYDYCIVRFNQEVAAPRVCYQRIVVEKNYPNEAIGDWGIKISIDETFESSISPISNFKPIPEAAVNLGLRNCLTEKKFDSFADNQINGLDFTKKRGICKLTTKQWKGNFVEGYVQHISHKDCTILQKQFVSLVNSCEISFVVAWGWIFFVLTSFFAFCCFFMFTIVCCHCFNNVLNTTNGYETIL